MRDDDQAVAYGVFPSDPEEGRPASGERLALVRHERASDPPTERHRAVELSPEARSTGADPTPLAETPTAVRAVAITALARRSEPPPPPARARAPRRTLGAARKVEAATSARRKDAYLRAIDATPRERDASTVSRLATPAARLAPREPFPGARWIAAVALFTMVVLLAAWVRASV